MRSLYIAAPFTSRFQLQAIVREIRAKGVDVTSRWIFSNPQIGEASRWAHKCLEDIKKAEALAIDFTQGASAHGGMFVELGFAYAIGRNIHIIGEFDNIFLQLDYFPQHKNWEEFILSL